MNKNFLWNFFTKCNSGLAVCGRKSVSPRYLHRMVNPYTAPTPATLGILSKFTPITARNYAIKRKLSPENSERFGQFSGTERIVFLDCHVDKKCKKYKRLLVMFYAPWCRHSIVLKPEFAKAAALSDTEECRLGVVDCNYHQKAVDKYQIDGFPTLLLFENGELKEEYDGPRKAKDILNYIESKNIADRSE